METPAVLIDMDIVEANIRAFQAHCDKIGIKVRPHIKTHKIPKIAKLQIQAGAAGINCQKIGEAEVMAAAGIEDILITYNILGAEKLERLLQLSKSCRLSVTADNLPTIAGLSETFARAGSELTVLVECDTGAGRCGVQTPEEAQKLAQVIHTSEGLVFGGLMTYPPMTDQAAAQEWLSQAHRLIEENGIACPVVSSGGSPNMWRAGEVPIATEHRIGTYVYNDRSLIKAGVCGVENCAMTVAATIVSRPTENRAIIDSGSKVLTSDLLGLPGYGLIAEHPKAVITSLNEEHGIVDLSETDWQPQIGDLIRIIPNHCCVVSNMVDQVILHRSMKGFSYEPVAARGCVT